MLLAGLLRACLISAVSIAGQERAVLDNGIVLVMLPIPGSERVAVEAFYEVGNVDEPAGMTQAAHLLEHLVCHGATASFEPRESIEELSALGLANAETLADFTHYDYVVPPGELARVLAVEAERLGSLEITEAIVDEEAPRCYAEVDSVAANPRGGMLKHGLSALAQSWRHGASEAFVRTGLEDYAITELERFRAATHRPGNLTLVVVGEIEPGATLALVKEHLGSLRDDPERSVLPPIDWPRTPRRASVKWDGPFRVACIAYPPPADPLERLLLDARGNVLASELLQDPELAPLVQSISTTSSLNGVGHLPFFVYAVPAEGVELDALAARLGGEVEERCATLVDRNVLFAMRVQIAQRAKLADVVDMGYVASGEAALVRQGWRPEATRAQVIGQLAVEIGMVERQLGARRDALLESLNRVKAEDVQALCKRVIAPEKRITTFLVPSDR